MSALLIRKLTLPMHEAGQGMKGRNFTFSRIDESLQNFAETRTRLGDFQIAGLEKL
jgi:hypothetical protein